MKKDLRFCLIGRGSIGTRHIKNLKTLSYNNIIAYSEDYNKNKDVEFENKYNIKTVHDLDKVKLFEPDALIIANPTAKHLKFAKIATEINSHIFMEKPLSHSLEGVHELEITLSRKNLTFFLANNLRYHPALCKIKELIDAGGLGNIYFARIMAGRYLPDWHNWEDYRNSYSARKELGGGVVLTLQHEIDYAYLLFGRFRRIKSCVRKISDLDIDVEDIALIIIETEAGHLLEIHLDYLQRPPKRTIHIQGTEGSIEYQFGDKDLKYYDFNEQVLKDIVDLEDYDANQMYIDEMEYFVESINDDKKHMSNLEDAKYVLKACMDIKMESI
jgi:predicted dehydrogenase|tara:strand:+ start:42 stop:1028 length:987 start_codon:yes stop_codon:yes gene_type:complete